MKYNLDLLKKFLRIVLSSMIIDLRKFIFVIVLIKDFSNIYKDGITAGKKNVMVSNMYINDFGKDLTIPILPMKLI